MSQNPCEIKTVLLSNYFFSKANWPKRDFDTRKVECKVSMSVGNTFKIEETCSDWINNEHNLIYNTI